MDEEQSELPFDRVVIGAGEKRRDLTLEAYLELPFYWRARLVLQRQCEFFDGASPVDRGVALRALRERARKLGAGRGR